MEKVKVPSEYVVGRLGKKGSEGANHSVHVVAALTFPFFPSPTDLHAQLLKHTKYDIVCEKYVDIFFQMVSTCSSLGG